MQDCELCETIDWEEDETYRIVDCKTCGAKMLVLQEHRQFTEFEKTLIGGLYSQILYPEKRIRWTQHKIKDHAHCHFE